MRLNNNAIGLIFIVAFLSMLGPFSIDTYLPSFPAIEAEFSVNRARLSQTIAWYMVATAVSTLFWGPLSDRVGRRQVILLTLVLYIVASLSCALATDYSAFLTSRVFQGVAASGGLVTGRAIIRDAHDSEAAHRTMSYVLMLFALAPAIAPVIGGWLHDIYGWRSVFYFLSLYGVMMLLASSLFLSETLEKSSRQSFHPLYVMGVYARTLLNIEFLMLVISLGVSFAGLFLYIAGSPTLILKLLGLQSTEFAVQFVPMTVGIIAGSFLSGRLANRWAKPTIIKLAFCVMFSGAVINLLQANLMPPSLFSVIAPIVVYAFGVALSMPAFSILAIDHFPGNKGAASAVQSFVQIMISALIAGGMLLLINETIAGFAFGQMLLLIISLLFWCVYYFRQNMP